MKSWRVIAIAMVVSALALSTADAEPRHGRGDGWRGGGGHNWGGRSWYRPYHYNAGEAFWGGVVGGVLGNIFRPAPPPVVIESPPVVIQSPPVIIQQERTVEWCMAHYRSYNVETGTFTGYDGIQRPCP